MNESRARFLHRCVMLSSILCVAAIHVGCVSNGFSLNALSMPTPKVPTRMVVTMSAVPLENNSVPVANGAVCRLYLFAGKDAFPLEARGSLKVMAFDVSKQSGTANEPNGVYEIEAERMATHYRKDTLGHSYVFWFPYEPQQRTQVVYNLQFTNEDGTVVKSSPVAVDIEPLANIVAAAAEE